MSKAILNWKCDACGDAENCDASCVLTVFAGEPTVCPVSEDDCEWRPAESNEAASKSTAECRKDCDVAEQRRKLDNQNTDLVAEIATFAAWRAWLEKQAKEDNAVVRYERKRAGRFEDENVKLKKQILEYEQTEASVCPEDVGKREYVATLKSMLQEVYPLLRHRTHSDSLGPQSLETRIYDAVMKE